MICSLCGSRRSGVAGATGCDGKRLRKVISRHKLQVFVMELDIAFRSRTSTDNWKKE